MFLGSLLSISLFSHQALSDNRPWGGFSRPDPMVNQPPAPGYKGRYNPWHGQGMVYDERRSGSRALPDAGSERIERPLVPGGVPAYGYPYGMTGYPYGGTGLTSPYSGLDYPYYGYSPLSSPGGWGSPYGGGWPGSYDYWGW